MLNIALVGFGEVGKSFVKLLQIKKHLLPKNMKLKYIIKSNGGIYDKDGLNIDEIVKYTNSNNNIEKHALWSDDISFKDILKNKDVNKLNLWIEDSLNLGISEIKSFINGLKQDIDAVKNAISLDYNNGLAEGSVNKIKVIKRIMYGRCNFETLRNKVINLENLK